MHESKILDSTLEQLRTDVCLRSGIKAILPSDCRRLSYEIYRETQKTVSETTLKRFYGFARSDVKPSVFTLNALAEYAGYQSWKQYNITHAVQPVVNFAIDRTLAVCRRVTASTLQLSENKSGIAFNKTIPRKFLNDHISYFLDSSKTATLITAPSGYGKTVAICHWLEVAIKKNQAKNGNDIYLFLSGSSFISGNEQGRNISDWLYTILGISGEEEILQLEQHYLNKPGSFFLIIDGFGNEMNELNFSRSFDQLLDVIEIYKKFSWFKVLITLRPSKWRNNRYKITNPDTWFFGFVDNDFESNFPLFDYHEIDKITETFGTSGITFQTPVSDFSYPLYLQYHLQEAPKQRQITEVEMYDIASHYVLNNVYRATLSAEMLLLILEIAGKMDLRKGVYYVDKLELITFIETYRCAYEDLLNIDFIEEINASTPANYLIKVQITNKRLLAFSIAKKFLTKNINLFDEHLLTELENGVGNEIKADVIKWCIYLTVSNNYSCQLNLLDTVSLGPIQKQGIMLFTGRLIKKHLIAGTSAVSHSLTSTNKNIVNPFLGVEFISLEYSDTLNTLLQLQLNNHQRIAIHTTLAFNYLIQLDLAGVKHQIGKLQNFADEDLDSYSINPLHCLDAIYTGLRFGIDNKAALKNLPLSNDMHMAHLDTGDRFNEVLTVLYIYMLGIYKHPSANLNVIEFLEASFSGKSPTFNFLLSTLKVEMFNMLDQEDQALAIFKKIETDAEGRNNDTQFLKICFETLKLKLHADKPEVLKEIPGFIEKCNRLGFNFAKLNTLSYLVARRNIFKSDLALLKDIQAELSRMIEASGCKTESIQY